MKTLSATFAALNKAGSKRRSVLVQVQDEIIGAEETLSADWTANTEEHQVDYTTQPGNVLLYRSSGAWSSLSPTGTLPGTRRDSVAVKYNGKMIIFGGQTGGTPYNDVWELDLLTLAWTQKFPTGTPPAARAYHEAVLYNGKMYVFGGYDGTSIYNDVWELNLSTFVWTQKSPTGGPPAARYNHTCIEYNGKMYLFGGEDTIPVTPTYYNDIWELNLSTFVWTQKSPTGGPPAARTQHVAAEDNGKLYIHAGHDQSYTTVNDFWELNLSTFVWTQLSPPGTVPSARLRHSAVTYRRYMVIFGGGGPINEVWKYDFINGLWKQETSGATARDGHVSIVDDYNRMLVFAGYNGTSYLNDLYADDNLFYYDTGFLLTDVMDVGQVPTVPGEWQIGDKKPSGTDLIYKASASDSTNFDVWLQWEIGYSPQEREQASLITRSSKFYLFGGRDGSTYYNDVWEYNPATKTWSLITTTGTAPSSRCGHRAIIYNSTNMYVIGGYNGSSYYNDVHELNLSTLVWTQKSPSGGPPATRAYHSATLAGSNITVFGGYNGSALNDVWRYSITGNSWTQRTVASPPSARYNHTAIAYGATNYIFGGQNGSTYYDEMWALYLDSDPIFDTWTQKTDAPEARAGHVAVVSGSNVFINGGTSGSDKKSTIVYSITGNSWDEKADSDDATVGACALLYGSYLYMFGGLISGSASDKFASYGPVTANAVDLGIIQDGDTITTLKRYYMVRAYLTGATDRDETSVLSSIRADFSTYLDVIHHTEPGKISGITNISTLSTSIDDFEKSSISSITITLPFAARISKWMAERKPKNRIVKVKFGFIDPSFTYADYLDVFYGQIYDAEIAPDNKVKLLTKSFHADWKKQVPESWNSVSDNVTWENIHHIDVMLDIIQNYLEYRDSKIDYASFYTVRAALPGWKVSRTITNDPVEAKELLEELRLLTSSYYILQGTGKVSLKRWDSTASAVASLRDADFLERPTWKGNYKSLINHCFTYYDYDGTTGDEAADFNELDAHVRTTSRDNWQEKAYKIIKDKWTDVLDASQVIARREVILDRYEDPPPIIMVSIAAKWIALENADFIDLTTRNYPSTTFTGCTDKKFQIVKLTPDWLKSRISLIVLEV